MNKTLPTCVLLALACGCNFPPATPNQSATGGHNSPGEAHTGDDNADQTPGVLSGERPITVKGYIRDFTGPAIPGASVTVSKGSSLLQRSLSGGDGYFEMHQLTGRPLQLRSEKVGYVASPDVTSLHGTYPEETVEVDMFNTSPPDPVPYAASVAMTIEFRAKAQNATREAYLRQWNKLSAARLKPEFRTQVAEQLKEIGSPAIKYPEINKNLKTQLKDNRFRRLPDTGKSIQPGPP